MHPGSYKDLRQFTKWWWDEGRPYAPPADCVRVCQGSHEFVLYRHGQFQVEQVTLLSGTTVQAHCHPNVRAYECHVVGEGIINLKVGGRWNRMPDVPSKPHPMKSRRMLINAGQWHKGMATSDNVALSFQHWLNGVQPTFITDDWVQEGGGTWT